MWPTVAAVGSGLQFSANEVSQNRVCSLTYSRKKGIHFIITVLGWHNICYSAILDLKQQQKPNTEWHVLQQTTFQ